MLSCSLVIGGLMGQHAAGHQLASCEGLSQLLQWSPCQRWLLNGATCLKVDTHEVYDVKQHREDVIGWLPQVC